MIGHDGGTSERRSTFRPTVRASACRERAHRATSAGLTRSLAAILIGTAICSTSGFGVQPDMKKPTNTGALDVDRSSVLPDALRMLKRAVEAEDGRASIGPVASEQASAACGPACDFCWCGTQFEGACPLSWRGDGDCDCGCQFCDIDCPDCSGQGCGGQSTCGDGVCAPDETPGNCPCDCSVRCEAQPANVICMGDTYGLNSEMCVATYELCDPCGPQCDYCWTGTVAECACPTSWIGDGDCDCGCQFDDAIDCGSPRPCDPCEPTPAPATVCVEVVPPDCGAASCLDPSICDSVDPVCARSQLDPGTGLYLFCPAYMAGACQGEVCVRLWIDNPGLCDPELWWRFDQIDCCGCGDGICDPFCDEHWCTCLEDCIAGDFSGDGYLNMTDFSEFVDCMTGPCPGASCGPQPDGLCCIADFDRNGSVDLRDFSLLQALFDE